MTNNISLIAEINGTISIALYEWGKNADFLKSKFTRSNNQNFRDIVAMLSDLGEPQFRHADLK
ncbi:MAG: hypothetical protein A3C44_07275 [Gammaproteobacteria bacterium RIFCSPHIGHO2_02_FULL_39_13]|nr:MAG: hypothetical protein A3C44_07275 [Gammaproteobacteria bacterium RIFCSPHIGHO2_02_FULL_39_13]OGT50032.1 MAG: hypothetical protein A3E53_02380 [Gammaproteobacteria bacterium RIFCSPHIGHO2_12_FULL_39_24]